MPASKPERRPSSHPLLPPPPPSSSSCSSSCCMHGWWQLIISRVFFCLLHRWWINEWMATWITAFQICFYVGFCTKREEESNPMCLFGALGGGGFFCFYEEPLWFHAALQKRNTHTHTHTQTNKIGIVLVFNFTHKIRTGNSNCHGCRTSLHTSMELEIQLSLLSKLHNINRIGKIPIVMGFSSTHKIELEMTY